jgi:hypothetical protein
MYCLNPILGKPVMLPQGEHHGLMVSFRGCIFEPFDTEAKLKAAFLPVLFTF